MTTADTRHELEQSTKIVHDARSAYLRVAQERHKLIRRALGAGIKPADIARLTGLTRARITQLR